MRVSVVVPTYRRPQLLAKCLDALVAQEFAPTDFEILIADDANDVTTKQKVAEISAKSRPGIAYLAVTGVHGPAAARNVGWRAARGDIVAFTDDDCIPDPGWLATGVAAFSPDVAAVSGRVVVPRASVVTDYERDTAGLERADFVTANCFCRRAVLEAIGGFDEQFKAAWREDSDLHFALLATGRQIVRVAGAVVVHPIRSAPWGISVPQQKKSLFDALLYKKHPRLYREKIRSAPPLDYYTMVLLLGLAVGAAVMAQPWTAAAAGLGWMVLYARFCYRRLRGTSHAPAHVAEMIATSVLIPPLSVFWRLYGACKFRVLFA